MGLKRGIPSVEFQLELGVKMFRAADGGPTRFPVTGLKRNSTHIHTPAKAGRMVLPAESNPELAVMRLLDVSTSVLRYMAQPHQLEFQFQGKRSVYTPDIEITAPFWFAEQLLQGVPFVRAALKMPSKRSVNDPLVLIVIEVKKRRDKESEDYKSKLKEVDAIYNRNGFFFFIIEEEVDLNSIDCSHLPSILMDETLVVPQDVIQIALDFLRNADGVTTYAAMMDVLGGGPRGREITNYLHIKGIIWADLSNNPLMREDITRVAMPPIIGAKRQAMAQLARMAA